MRGYELSLGGIVSVIISATAASIAAAAIPQGGLVTMVMVLDTIGLHSSDVSKRNEPCHLAEKIRLFH